MLAVDDGPDTTIKLAEEDIHLSLGQLITVINSAMPVNMADQDNGRLVIVPKKKGSAAQLVFGSAREGDVTKAILGFNPPRTYFGADAAPGRVVGGVSLKGTIDLSTARFLKMSVDGNTAVDGLNCTF